MNTQIIIALVLMVILIAVAAVLWYRGQKKLVLKALGFLVHKAEVYFSAGENQVKINFVLQKIRAYVPIYLVWLWNEEWIKRQVKIILLEVEKSLGYKHMIDDVTEKAKSAMMEDAQDYAKKTVKLAADYMTAKLLGANVNGDYNLVDNEQVKMINAELKEKVSAGMNLRAYINGETDFVKSNLRAGVEVEKRF